MADMFRVGGSFKSFVKRVEAAGAVVSRAFGDGRGKEAVKIMRLGTKGVRQQFVDTTEYRLGTATPWKRTAPFGSRKAGKTMLGTGAYRSAFLGGAGAIENISDNTVEIGVDRNLFPQVKIHQGSQKVVTIRPTQKARWFLGLTYGVWLKKSTMRNGLKIARRRVSVSSSVRKEVMAMVKRETGSAMRGVKLSTKAVR